ncbi:4-hydroxybenzoate polyprenyltransferase [hydrothermal vent metagenome]|uniref:4-hydroxybenzoate polyprenyltransferase n=1 Tax=hydrothermal vent metagenome TaxID=652676 RepID=A0A1W1BGS5_9ZZZZ
MNFKKISAYFRLARLDKPIGIWLLLLPTLFNILFTTNILPLEIILVFVFGSIIMRSAGCVINDIWDIKIDKQVQRTKNRPIASGEISILNASIFFIFLSLLGLYLLLKLNTNTLYLGFVFLIMVIIYPLMKRFIALPQLFLAFTFNAGVLMSSMAIYNKINLSSWILYSICFFWILAYDTVYAHQDKKDDLKIGVKSSAIYFDNWTKIYISICYSILFIGLIVIAWLNHNHLIFYIGLLLIMTITFYKIKTLNLDNPKECHHFFINNSTTAWFLLAILLLDKMVK